MSSRRRHAGNQAKPDSGKASVPLMHEPAVACPPRLSGVAKQWSPRGPLVSGRFFVTDLGTGSSDSFTIHDLADAQVQDVPTVCDWYLIPPCLNAGQTLPALVAPPVDAAASETNATTATSAPRFRVIRSLRFQTVARASGRRRECARTGCPPLGDVALVFRSTKPNVGRRA